MAQLILNRAIVCKADVCSLWNVLTDTERLNRAVGMEPVSFAPKTDGKGAARFVGKTVLGGIAAEYDELPFEFEYLKRYRVRRRMHGGPASELSFGIQFDSLPNAEGTKVVVELGIAPRLGLFGPFLRMSASSSLRKFEEEVRRVDASLAVRGKAPPLPRTGAIDEDAIGRVTAKLLDRCDPDIVRRLVALVRDGSDVDASRIRPFVIADDWEKDRRDVLGVALTAVKEGLLELRWELVCPSCRVASGTVPTLAQLGEHGTCQLCDLDFGLDVDESVEATFSPSPAIRDVDAGPYCIGGPSRVPHVIAQDILPGNGKAVMDGPSEPGRYRVFVRGGEAASLEIAEGGAPEVDVSADALPKEVVRLGLGAKISIENRGDETHAKIERSTWANQAATARDVTALPAFRRDFASDVLRPGASLRVSNVTLFFSDLTGSTQLYSEIGDASAFRLVQDHFDVVLAVIEQHHGSLVKTIGDAVMAVFASEADGVRASIAVLREFARFRTTSDTRGKVDIKLGLYGGPCYVVTANGILDYFGQTVNIAARLQGQAESGELVIDEALGERAIERGLIDAEMVGERWAPKLKGVSGDVRAMRVRAS